MKIAIVDDSPIDLDILRSFAAKYCESTCIAASVQTFSDSYEFLKCFCPGMFDLLFLDIMMDNLNGISLAKEIRKRDSRCFIIFSTASEDYAVEGFKVRAFDYMVKPLSYERFRETCDLCIRQLPADTHYIEVKEGRTYTKILVSDILYTDYYNHYIQIHTDTSIIRSYMSFSDFEPMLKPYPQFLCCYRNCTVNMDYIDVMEDRSFILKNKIRVPIAAKLKNDVHKAYREYQFQQKLL